MWGNFCLPSQIRVTRKRKIPPTSAFVEAEDFSDHYVWDLSSAGSEGVDDGEVVPAQAVCDVAVCRHSQESGADLEFFLQGDRRTYEVGAFGAAAECLG